MVSSYILSHWLKEQPFPLTWDEAGRSVGERQRQQQSPRGTALGTRSERPGVTGVLHEERLPSALASEDLCFVLSRKTFVFLTGLDLHRCWFGSPPPLPRFLRSSFCMCDPGPVILAKIRSTLISSSVKWSCLSPHRLAGV